MKSNPLISIIIPTFNRANMIGETLDSIIAQTYSNWECIVVDDGSKDNIQEVVNSYIKIDSRFSFYNRPNNYRSGGNGARNYGFTLAKGAYIKWFDSDDLMEEYLLEKQMSSMMQNNKKISVCLFDKYNFTFSKLKQESSLNINHYNPYFDYILKLVRINLQTALWDKKIVEKYVLDENLKKSQEYDFIQHILKDFYGEVFYLNKVLVKTRNHSESITGSFLETKDDEKISDAILVKYRVIQTLPNDTLPEVMDKMDVLFFRMVYFAFKCKKNNILFKYLYKITILNKKRYLVKTVKIFFLYVAYILTNKGRDKYKNLVN